MTPQLVFGSPFPVPQFGNLPRSAPKPLLRSWFVHRDGYDDVGNPRVAIELRHLLTQLDPHAAPRARNASARLLYVEILKWCRQRFPIQEYILYSVEEEWDDEDAWGMFDVLPVEPRGFSYADEMPTALTICGLLCLWNVFAGEYAAATDLLKKHPWLNAYKPPEPVRTDTSRNQYLSNYREPPAPPRGRVWRKPWHALQDACEWVTARTGIAFLDYDQEMLDESGFDTYPRLTLDEIRACQEQWRDARAIIEHVNKLCDYVGNDPKRMRLLADVLARKPYALRQVTRPSSTTLAQTFLREVTK